MFWEQAWLLISLFSEEVLKLNHEELNGRCRVEGRSSRWVALRRIFECRRAADRRQSATGLRRWRAPLHRTSVGCPQRWSLDLSSGMSDFEVSPRSLVLLGSVDLRTSWTTARSTNVSINFIIQAVIGLNFKPPEWHRLLKTFRSKAKLTYIVHADEWISLIWIIEESVVLCHKAFACIHKNKSFHAGFSILFVARAVAL